MTVKIYWQPISEEAKHFHRGTSSALQCLESVFGHTISENSIPTLRGMAASAGDEFYNEVADMIEKVGTIEVWGE